MEINPTTNEINIKIVYYGPGLSGKTTNLEVIYQKTPENHRGKLTNIATEQDRTLFFDYMPLDLGRVGTLRVRLRIFTVPGQVYYNSTRKLVLRCVDGVVFVADSQEDKSEENIQSLENLRENLAEYNLSLERIPLVMQFNKRDLPNIMSIEKMNSILNSSLDVPVFPAVAVQGDGVFQCLRSIANLTLSYAENSVTNTKKRKSLSDSSTRIPKSEVKTTFQPPKKKSTTKTSFPFFKKPYKKITESHPVQNKQDMTPPSGVTTNHQHRVSPTPSLGIPQEKLQLPPATPRLGITSKNDSGVKKLSDIFKKKVSTSGRETSKIFRPKNETSGAFKVPERLDSQQESASAFKTPEKPIERQSEKKELHPNLIRSNPHPNVLRPAANKAKQTENKLHPNVMRLSGGAPKPKPAPVPPNIIKLPMNKPANRAEESAKTPSKITKQSVFKSEDPAKKLSESSLFRKEDIEPSKKLSESSLFRKEDIEPSKKLSESSLFRKEDIEPAKKLSESSLFTKKEDIEPAKKLSESSLFTKKEVKPSLIKPGKETKIRLSTEEFKPPTETAGRGLKSKIKDLKKYKELFGDSQ